MGYLWNDGNASGLATCLLDDIKVRGAIPTNQQTYTPTRLLNLANAVMKAKVVPGVMRAREGYYSYDVDYAIDGRTNGYLIPPRFVGGKLEDAAFVSGTQRLQSTRFSEQNVEDYSTTANANPGIYIKRNRVFVMPSSPNWPTLRLTGILRPNQIIDGTTGAAKITGIAGTTVTCANTTFPIPSSWTTANTFDLLQDDGNYDWWAIDQTITAITATTITFSGSTLPTDLVVGDWVALARQTPLIQCPQEFHPYLAQEVANICLKAQGDETAFKSGEEEAKLLYDAALITISPRIEEMGRKIVNRTGILRRRF